MKKQMNEYVVLLREGASCTLPDACVTGAQNTQGTLAEAFNTQLSQWARASGNAADIVRTEASQAAQSSIVCTEDVAQRVVEAFAGSVATIRMQRENVITIPGELPKKARRPGFAQS